MDTAILQDLHTQLHAEQKRITSKSLAIEQSITRTNAESLLEALPYYDTSQEFMYDITRCIFEKRGKKFGMLSQNEVPIYMFPFLIPHFSLTRTVAKLETTLETVSKGSKQGESKYKIHSIALQTPNGASSTLSAHMQTMSLLHDHQDTVFDPTIACDVIEPALEVERVDKDQLRMRRIQGNIDGNANGTSNSVPNNIQPKPKVTKKTTVAAKKGTSAAAFFKTDTAPQKKSKASNPKPKAVEKKKSSTTKKSSTVRAQAKESEPPPHKKKGNADDFVGDMDEDEEFVKEDEKRKTRNAKKEKKVNNDRKIKENSRQKQERRKPLPRQEGEEDVDMDPVDDDIKVVQGAMDDFASKTTVKRDNANEDQKGRKRRKQVLEEKTFVDENGFFRTETVSVWKEIEDDEDEESSAKLLSSSAAAAKAKPKSTKNMKQQGLMGFFAKK